MVSTVGAIEARGGWLHRKRAAMRRLEEDRKLGLVDEDIWELLKRINDSKYLYTTSSCSGRVVVIWSPVPRNKRSASILGKWHSKPEFREFADAIERGVDKCKRVGGYTWASFHPLALDVICADYGRARDFINALMRGGFKHACMREGKHGYMIMVRSGTKVDMPVCVKGINLSECENYVSSLYEILSTYLEDAKRWLKKLYILVLNFLMGDEDTALNGTG
jgi:tRNA wybutosine-synthesizing protein 3